jgi:hypothetical protein
MKEDSITGIYDTLSTCAQISKYAGGIGLSVHDIRAKGSYITTNFRGPLLFDFFLLNFRGISVS